MEHAIDLFAAPTDLSVLDALHISVHRGMRAVAVTLAATPARRAATNDALRTYWSGVAEQLRTLMQVEAALHAALADRSPRSRAAISRANANHATIEGLISELNEAFVELASTGCNQAAIERAASLDRAVADHLDAANRDLRWALQRTLDVVEHQRIFKEVLQGHRSAFAGPFVAAWVAPSHWDRVRGHRLFGRPGRLAQRRHARLVSRALGEHRRAVMDERFDPPVLPATPQPTSAGATSIWPTEEVFDATA